MNICPEKKFLSNVPTIVKLLMERESDIDINLSKKLNFMDKITEVQSNIWF